VRYDILCLSAKFIYTLQRIILQQLCQVFDDYKLTSDYKSSDYSDRQYICFQPCRSVFMSFFVPFSEGSL